MSNRIILTSEEKDHSKLQEVKEVLKSIPGNFFSYKPKKELDKPFIEWTQGDVPVKNDFFDSMNEFRDQDKLDSSDFLIFLTSRKIPGGYFNGIQFEKKNIFLDLGNWERLYFKGIPDRYPIAFHVLISVLINHYFDDEARAIAALHRIDKGCILDFNGEKNKVDLKIQTARICPDCINTLLQLNSDPNLLSYFRFGIERIRQDIVNGEYYKKIAPQPVPVYLREAAHKRTGYQLEFEGIGFLDLDPICLTVYLNFLRKKREGIRLYSIGLDYYFLLELYKKFTRHSDSEEEDEEIVQELLNEVEKLKKQTIVLPEILLKEEKEVALFEAALKVINKELIDSKFKNHPKVKSAIEVIKELNKEQKAAEIRKKKKEKNEETISRLSKLKIENGQFKEFKNNALNERIHLIHEDLANLLGTFGLQDFYRIVDRGSEKFGVSPDIKFEDATGLINSIDAKIKKFDPIKIIWDIEKNPKSDPL
jgi:hypothetical protein